MLIEIGQKVRVVDDLNATSLPTSGLGISAEMRQMEGQVFTVTGITHDFRDRLVIHLDCPKRDIYGANWAWAPDCFKPV